MWSPVELSDGRTANFAQGWEYAVVDSITVSGHGGGNRADVRHFIKDGRSVTVVLLTNGSEADIWPGSISYGVARIVFASHSADGDRKLGADRLCNGTSMMSSTQDRLEKLEMLAAEQERMLDELSEVLAHQQKLIEKLQSRLSASDDRIAELEAGLPAPTDEKPPHY